MKNLIQTMNNFFNKIWRFIDRRIIVPITKLILKLTGNFDRSGKGNGLPGVRY